MWTPLVSLYKRQLSHVERGTVIPTCENEVRNARNSAWHTGTVQYMLSAIVIVSVPKRSCANVHENPVAFF